MSSEMGTGAAPADGADRSALADRLGHLLKRAHLRYFEFSSEALAPFDINARELGVLLTLRSLGPTSQQDAARSLKIDRTTMVALVDALEAKGIVVRRPHEEDRRRNVVEFTEQGLEVLEKAAAASDEAERRFLDHLSDEQVHQLKTMLRTLI